MSLHYHPCNAKACEPSGTSVADLVAAERERIVAWIRTSIGDEADTGELADDIARGAHMEES